MLNMKLPTMIRLSEDKPIFQKLSRIDKLDDKKKKSFLFYSVCKNCQEKDERHTFIGYQSGLLIRIVNNFPYSIFA